MVPSGVQNAQYIWNLAHTGQMRGHFEKTRFDLYLGESRSQWPNFGYVSKGQLYVSYEPYKLQIHQEMQKRATIYWLMHWKYSLTYISMKVGHSDLNHGM